MAVIEPVQTLCGVICNTENVYNIANCQYDTGVTLKTVLTFILVKRCYPVEKRVYLGWSLWEIYVLYQNQIILNRFNNCHEKFNLGYVIG